MTKAEKIEIKHLKRLLDIARRLGDELKIELAEASLNQYLDRCTNKRG